MKLIKCICQSGEIPEDVIKDALSEKEYKRLERLRLSRKIDNSEDMIWCPNLKCEKDIKRNNKSEIKVSCTHCGNFACFKC